MGLADSAQDAQKGRPARQQRAVTLLGVGGMIPTARVEGYICSFQARLLSLQRWGLIDLPLRASNEGPDSVLTRPPSRRQDAASTPRPRVARA